MQTNRLTIIPTDRAVYTDVCTYVNLDLSSCGIPSDIHALQWMDNSGWLEFIGPSDNQVITELPEWAINCLNVWEQNHQQQLLLIEQQNTTN